MAMNRKGSTGIDKGRMFEKTVAGSAMTQKGSASAGKMLSQKENSGIVAKVFRAASERTGTFESRNAKK